MISHLIRILILFVVALALIVFNTSTSGGVSLTYEGLERLWFKVYIYYPFAISAALFIYGQYLIWYKSFADYVPKEVDLKVEDSPVGFIQVIDVNGDV